jgi:hypothetical protein
MNCIPKHARCENCGNPYRPEQICAAPFHIVTVSEAYGKPMSELRASDRSWDFEFSGEFRYPTPEELQKCLFLPTSWTDDGSRPGPRLILRRKKRKRVVFEEDHVGDNYSLPGAGLIGRFSRREEEF